MQRGKSWRLASPGEMAELRAERPRTRGIPLLRSAALPFAMSAQLVACNCKCGHDSTDSGVDSGLCLPPAGGPQDDPDLDGLTNAQEAAAGTDRLLADTDFDGLLDGDEPSKKTSALDPDSDDGGTIDGIEVASGTDPLVAKDDVPIPDVDADVDGLADAVEMALATDPANPDTDGDGLTDGAEATVHRTSPILVDTDGDGRWDGNEVDLGQDPKDTCG